MPTIKVQNGVQSRHDLSHDAAPSLVTKSETSSPKPSEPLTSPSDVSQLLNEIPVPFSEPSSESTRATFNLSLKELSFLHQCLRLYHFNQMKRDNLTQEETTTLANRLHSFLASERTRRSMV